MTQNGVSRQLHRVYCTENQLLNNYKHSEMRSEGRSKTKKRSTTILEMSEGYSSKLTAHSAERSKQSK